MSWRRGLEKFSAAEREAFDHMAATLEYDAGDVYPTREAAELAASIAIVEQRQAAAVARALRAESPPPPERGEND